MKTYNYLAIVLCVVLILTGCSASDPVPEIIYVTATPTPAPTATPVPTLEPIVTDIESVIDESNLSESMQFVRDLKVGWNLGNTFDANTDETGSKKDLEYETLWCGAKTSEVLIDMLQEAGFNTIRVPVSWHNHVSGDDFTISEVWLDRVQEVVDYIYSRGMYVILNIHHDCYPEYYYPSSDCIDNSVHYFECIWSQVGERFKDYDDHLILESVNEPRLKDTQYEWNLVKNNPDCDDAVACLNTLNQTFVNTVRATGGNNTTRYLMVPGYDASPEGALHSGFSIPEDTATDRIIISVHAYTPYNFALCPPTESYSTDFFDADSKSSTGDIDSFMQKLYDKFIVNGTPVVIGEFGARDKGGNTQSRIDYAGYYVAKARSYGMTCLWWDNNAFTGDGENFGLISRKVNRVRYQEIIDALMDNCE